MPVEIERKFLIDKNKWKPEGTGEYLCQAYLSEEPERTVRVRISGKTAFLTIKGKVNGITRQEFEYKIPVGDAQEILKLSIHPPIKKYRHKVLFENQLWEIDVFEGENNGLILAEVELESEKQEIKLPEWIDKEVSGDIRYYNSYMAKHPYKTWK